MSIRLFVLLGKRSGDVFIDAMEITREASLLGDQVCWHPVLPDPARPPRRAPRHPAVRSRPTRPWFVRVFGFDRFVQNN